eukprot:TRINITY_DN16563_c0_g1_i1.p1 TRINITY_DN16563_c0_g1~~TRINITY_DN16563_c0_g1_i1.p1  ORF type:complete len:219 (-),score=63.04 TRINITY_DN16563_c0_g1_i1:500-1156(-)
MSAVNDADKQVLELHRLLESMKKQVDLLHKQVSKQDAKVSLGVPSMENGQVGELDVEVLAEPVVPSFGEKSQPLGNNDVRLVISKPAGVDSSPVLAVDEVKALDVADEAMKRKKINKILAAVPAPGTSNPIAALTNFCRHQLKFDINFEILEIPSANAAEPNYCVRVFFPDDEGWIAEFTHTRKKFAKEQAAKMGLKILNENRELLTRYIDRSFVRST